MHNPEEQKTITIERPTGPRITFSERQSLGELVVVKIKTKAKTAYDAIAKTIKTAAKHPALSGMFATAFLVSVITVVLEKTTSHVMDAISIAAMRAPSATPPAASYQGPGDTISGAVAWWGLQPITAAYSGNIVRLCDSATGTTCAIATASGGVVTYPTIGGFACDNATHTCIVDTLYDQSGALACAGSVACNLTSTNGVRPSFIAAGAANGCPNTALPCMQSNGTTQCMATAANFTLSQPYTIVAVGLRPTTATVNRFYIGNFNSTTNIGSAFAANQFWIRSGGTSITITNTDDTWHAVAGVFNGTSPSSIASTDGSTTTGSTAAGGWSAETIGFMGSDPYCSANQWLGKMVEGGIYNSALTSGNLGSLSTNAHSAGRWNF